MTEASGPTARLLTTVAARYGAQPGAIDEGHRAALTRLWHLAYREASTLAFAGAFRAIMVAFVIATLLVPLLRKPGAPVPAFRRALTWAPSSPCRLMKTDNVLNTSKGTRP